MSKPEPRFPDRRVTPEKSSCGVGFIASRRGVASHEHLRRALAALRRVEHRGASANDGLTGDGSGVMVDIPFELIGHAPGTVAVATLFVAQEAERRSRALEVFERAFEYLELPVLEYRKVPVRVEVLGPVAREVRPRIVQAIIRRPPACRTDASFDARLYHAKQLTRSKLRRADSWFDLYFTSLSTRTVVYKALCRAEDLDAFYPDLTNPRFETRFALFHRRFSTNTRTSWDKAQPFRLIAHNGEINTIAGNRSWCYSREQHLGLARDELLTHEDISDSGNANEMVEALRFRSSIPRLEEALAIMIPPADVRNDYYEFWGRAVEPWDGPALIAFSDGASIGARLDRNGFRPARWAATEEAFYLASEAGIFELDEGAITHKGTIRAGSGAWVNLDSGRVHLRDPSQSSENQTARFDARLFHVGRDPAEPPRLDAAALFGVTKEELDRVIAPMVEAGKEPIGSMGDTAPLAVLSDEYRSLYDYFFQDFAQVTNPPLDYLRERMVTDLTMHLGRRPNVFAPKELIPPVPNLRLDSPVVDPEQLAWLRRLKVKRKSPLRLLAHEIDCTFSSAGGEGELRRTLGYIRATALEAVRDGRSLLILSDRAATPQRPPVPSLLALRQVVLALNEEGLRLQASVVLDVGDVRSTHDLACAVGFGANGVCPRLLFDIAASHEHRGWSGLDRDARWANLRRALEQGTLKIMSKMGISVARSYQSSKLFSSLGLGPGLLRLFRGQVSRIGGLELEDLAQRILEHAGRIERGPREGAEEPADWWLPSTYQLMEHPRAKRGERHGMTAARSKVVHHLVRDGEADRPALLRQYEQLGRESDPISLRHLLRLRASDRPRPLAEVEPIEAITRRFGSGAMSFGAISAEAQRDLFVAMRRVGGRCNSGEGGENPYYFVDGTTATTKQVASGRFGVTAEYLVVGDEVEIKIAQGAKPGEGGQLMGVKVDEAIATARHASPGVDLISPPPLHDIYSIEDLKQLIYELRQLHPKLAVCVKLVAGRNIGTVAVGVVKAGADVIQISGGDGGTGAAPISSMKHAGLPWELGLVEVHTQLIENGLRGQVRLRVDGGLSTAEDLVKAAALGAEEFGFGKLLLVAEGCIMARICEKNRCPTGIATHDPKFKAKYKGSPEHVETLLRALAGRVREVLAQVGATSLEAVVGDTGLLELDPRHRELVQARHLVLGELLHRANFEGRPAASRFRAPLSDLNARIADDVLAAVDGEGPAQLSYEVSSTDRALLARACGALAERAHEARMAALRERPGEPDRRPHLPAPGSVRLDLTGSAGQGFAAFLVQGLDVELRGEANDSVCKSMSGGRVVVRPHPDARFAPEENVILGNCALYGATGGTLYVHGKVGDRFAVRNSGAVSVVEGAGLHACEYMTGGTVVVLGELEHNAGAGMTGGTLFLRRTQAERTNLEYVRASDLSEADAARLHQILVDYRRATHSVTAGQLLEDWGAARSLFVVVRPRC